ncbi:MULTISPECIES: hypothetical protein, partial [unclassified Aeromonas]|uniref:hypothetical protein n=1 Tax=unclassified Aeromonas TaxID=257493 RepID=UPI0022DFFB5C
EPAGMTTIGLSYSLVKISTKCAPALLVMGRPRGRPLLFGEMPTHSHFLQMEQTNCAPGCAPSRYQKRGFLSAGYTGCQTSQLAVFHRNPLKVNGMLKITTIWSGRQFGHNQTRMGK